MSEQVKRYDAVHLRYEDRNIRYGEGCEVEVVTASDYAALEAENARLERLVSHWQSLAVSNRKVADGALAQLAAIQGGMGEDVADVELIDKAQYQRITAAMAAEVERWERSFHDIHEPALRDAHAYIQELRAELAKVKASGWRNYSVNFARGEKCPPTLESAQAAWDRDQELIEEQRAEIAKLKQTINQLRQKQ